MSLPWNQFLSRYDSPGSVYHRNENSAIRDLPLSSSPCNKYCQNPTMVAQPASDETQDAQTWMGTADWSVAPSNLYIGVCNTVLPKRFAGGPTTILSESRRGRSTKRRPGQRPTVAEAPLAPIARATNRNSTPWHAAGEGGVVSQSRYGQRYISLLSIPL